MDEFFKELSKHYLGIAAAIFIAVVIALIIKEPKITLIRAILGAFFYFSLLLFSILLYKRGIKSKKGEGDKNV